MKKLLLVIILGLNVATVMPMVQFMKDLSYLCGWYTLQKIDSGLDTGKLLYKSGKACVGALAESPLTKGVVKGGGIFTGFFAIATALDLHRRGYFKKEQFNVDRKLLCTGLGTAMAIAGGLYFKSPQTATCSGTIGFLMSLHFWKKRNNQLSSLQHEPSKEADKPSSSSNKEGIQVLGLREFSDQQKQLLEQKKKQGKKK